MKIGKRTHSEIEKVEEDDTQGKFLTRLEGHGNGDDTSTGLLTSGEEAHAMKKARKENPTINRPRRVVRVRVEEKFRLREQSAQSTSGLAYEILAGREKGPF